MVQAGKNGDCTAVQQLKMQGIGKAPQRRAENPHPNRTTSPRTTQMPLRFQPEQVVRIRRPSSQIHAKRLRNFKQTFALLWGKC